MDKRSDEKWPVPQISSRTGISQDYANELQSVLNCARAYDEGIDLFALSGIKSIKLYSERYPESRYIDVVNDKNRASVEKLDSLAGKVNELLREDYRGSGKYLSLVSQMEEVIYGKKS